MENKIIFDQILKESEGSIDDLLTPDRFDEIIKNVINGKMAVITYKEDDYDKIILKVYTSSKTGKKTICWHNTYYTDKPGGPRDEDAWGKITGGKNGIRRFLEEILEFSDDEVYIKFD